MLYAPEIIELQHQCGMHCRKQKIECRKPTPKRRLRGKRGSSVPMDVTNTNFFTFACVAAAIRFLVPCATRDSTQIKACMEVESSSTSHLQVDAHACTQQR